MTDTFLKDEGDFTILGFQTDKAKKFAVDTFPIESIDKGTTEQVYKIGIDTNDIHKVKVWLSAANLTYEEF